MSAMRRPSGFKRMLVGKGFYAILAVCLLVIGGVVLVSFVGSPAVEREQDNTKTTTQNHQQVVERVTDVADTRTTASTKTTVSTTTPKTTATKAAPLFVLPGSNAVVNPFSGTTPVYNKTMGDWRCHNGADFGGNEGMTVKAVSDGTVKEIGEDASFGGVIVIDHGFGVQSRYCGVTASVKKGDTVKAGDPIGSLSGVPCESADGCHLHLEITVNDAYADPVQTIDKEVKYPNAE